MKNNVFFKSISKLTDIQRIECVIAAIITFALIIAVPSYAWFSYSRQMETMTKVKAPASLDIRAGNKDAIENFELRDIDIEDIKTNGSKCYVFCVQTGSTEAHYDIQLAHTTNIPFTYSLYRADKVEDIQEGFDVDYTPLNDSTYHTYYKKSELVSMEVLNPDDDSENITRYGRTLAQKGDGYYNITYDEADDEPEIYAIPLYSQAINLETRKEDYDFFILELSWNNVSSETEFDKWNQAVNNKETDIVYISASKHTE